MSVTKTKFQIPERGMLITKDSPDEKAREQGLDKLNKDLGDALDLMRKSTENYQETAKELKSLKETVETREEKSGEIESKIEKLSTQLAEQLTSVQACKHEIETLSREIDQPFYSSAADTADKDRENAIELQRRIFAENKSALAAQQGFVPDLDNLVNMKDYRSAVMKLMEVGLKSKQEIVAGFDEGERKAFDAASLGSAFFSPEMLGIEVDCEIECAEMLDLYSQVNVSGSNFMYPQVKSYGDIGGYDCPAKCDAEYGPEGNIQFLAGQTFDFRGQFCFNRDVLREANYDLLGFMMRAAARSYRINRNRALIAGDGVNEPLGWLTADCFTKVSTPSANPNHRDLRQFMASGPMEYGDMTSTMHQNTFAYFAAMIDSNNRFIFGDGLMGFSPQNVSDRIRISNCLPDPTKGGTRGSAANPFATGAFIMASGVWDRAYAAVTHRPMFMQQFEGGSTAWCVQYQFGAKDGGFTACCPAARTLQAG